MNVKGQEFSIFQGAPSIHVDNNQQRIEEEEALQDQRRRHAEVRNYENLKSSKIIHNGFFFSFIMNFKTRLKI